MSIDPVTTDASTGSSFNRYSYAANNPYKYIDPDGRQEHAAQAFGDQFSKDMAAGNHDVIDPLIYPGAVVGAVPVAVTLYAGGVGLAGAAPVVGTVLTYRRIRTVGKMIWEISKLTGDHPPDIKKIADTTTKQVISTVKKVAETPKPLPRNAPPPPPPPPEPPPLP